jgi:hypothetical protein
MIVRTPDERLTFLQAIGSRRKDALAGALPGPFAGTLVADGYAGYQHLLSWLAGIQQCCARIIRRCRAVAKLGPDGLQSWAENVIMVLREAHRAVEQARARSCAGLDTATLSDLTQRYDQAVSYGITHNRLRDWDSGNHPGYALGTWLRDYKEQVLLFTRGPGRQALAVGHPNRSLSGLAVISEHAEGPGHRNVRHRQVRSPPGTGRARPPRHRHRHRPVEPLGRLAGRVTRLDLARGRHRGLLASHRHGHLFIAGCTTNQGKFYPQFDHIALLSAPADVLLARIAARTGNPYGKQPAERAQILRGLAEVEPLLRATATIEIDVTAPLSQVVQHLENLT